MKTYKILYKFLNKLKNKKNYINNNHDIDEDIKTLKSIKCNSCGYILQPDEVNKLDQEGKFTCPSCGNIIDKSELSKVKINGKIYYIHYD